MSKERKKLIIAEIEANRLGLYELLEQNIENRKSLDQFKLSNDDFRSRGVALSRASEIAKTKTEATNSELNIRKTIDASVKLEYELITKLDDEIENEVSKKDGYVDIRELSKKILELDQNQKVASNG